MSFSWSHSSESLYRTCPAKYNFRYNLKIKAPQHIAAKRGVDTHQAVEDYISGVRADMHELISPHSELLERIKAGNRVIECKIGWDRNWKIVPWEKAWGRGVLDSAIILPDEVEIQEWKTGKIYEDHKDQRRLYSLISSIKWGVPKVTARTYYLDLNRIKKYTLKKPEALKADFNQRIYFMESDDVYAPRPGWYCGFCGYSKLKGGPCKKG